LNVAHLALSEAFFAVFKIIDNECKEIRRSKLLNLGGVSQAMTLKRVEYEQFLLERLLEGLLLLVKDVRKEIAGLFSN